MKVELDTIDREFLDRLNRLGSATIQEICAERGVTATAVRQRLIRLQALNLVHRETIRSGRGRPHHTYQLSEAGRRELGENYAELTRILWNAIQAIEDPSVRRATLDNVRRSLTEMYGQTVSAATPEERLKQLCGVLAVRGFNVEVDQGESLPILRENNCPYYDLAAEDPAICALEQSVFEDILGVGVTLTQCCLEGHSCCEFQMSPGKQREFVHSGE